MAPIDPATVDHIRRLLAAGQLTQGDIARRAGVCRNTVSLIATGRRPDRPPLAVEGPTFSGPFRRCPGCGGKVQMPCHACKTRADMAAQSPPPAA